MPRTGTVAVASIIIDWGVVVLPGSLTFSAAASPSGALAAVLAVVVLAAIIVVPGFILLFVLHEKVCFPRKA
jgi:cytochrome bd ubiquinol oxidase subunit II